MPFSFLPPFADASLIATFLFVFALVYATLSKSSVIDVKGANVAIAAVIGFFAATFPPAASFLQSILPVGAVLLVLVFFLIFVRDLLGKGSGDKLPAVVALIIALMLMAVLWERIIPFLPADVDPTSLLWILGVIIVLLIFYLVYRHAWT